jgi:hypothetical protein
MSATLLPPKPMPREEEGEAAADLLLPGSHPQGTWEASLTGADPVCGLRQSTDRLLLAADGHCQALRAGPHDHKEGFRKAPKEEDCTHLS